MTELRRLLGTRIRVDGLRKPVEDQTRRLLDELVELLALHQPISWVDEVLDLLSIP